MKPTPLFLLNRGEKIHISLTFKRFRHSGTYLDTYIRKQNGELITTGVNDNSRHSIMTTLFIATIATITTITLL